MTPAEFLAMHGTAPRVSRPAPEVVASCTPEVAAFIDPAGTLQDAGLVRVQAPANNFQAKLDALKQWPMERLRARIPAWAKKSGFPVKPFVPDLRQVLPRGPMTTLSNEGHRAWIFEEQFKERPEDPAEYVKAWDQANGYAPCPVQWITPKLGNFA